MVCVCVHRPQTGMVSQPYCSSPALLLQSWQMHCELQPLRFLDRELLPHLVFVTRRLAQFIGTAASCELLQTCSTDFLHCCVDSDPSDVVLVPNVTTGVNAVVHSLAKTYTADDTVLMFNTTYGEPHCCAQELQ